MGSIIDDSNVYELHEIKDKIIQLKRKKKAVILTHYYQSIEIDTVSDFVGDSFYLSQIASKVDAEIIIFAGVHFMAQSAKLLNPNKKVLLPNINAGCAMADMLNLEQLRQFKILHPNIPVICYINSSAEIKAESDICCTSSNAVEVVRSLRVPEVLFVPDMHLGKWVEKQLQNVRIISYSGFCPVHSNVTVEDVQNVKCKYPYAEIIAHPECRDEVVALANFVGSTKEIIDYIGASINKEFVIITEKGVVDRLKRDYRGKKFILISSRLVCDTMKLNTLTDILNCLENEVNEIKVSDSVFERARLTLVKMLDV